jgi:hypothetical protein
MHANERAACPACNADLSSSTRCQSLHLCTFAQPLREEFGCRVFLPSHFRYPKGTYIAPDGSVLPTAAIMQCVAAHTESTRDPPVSAFPSIFGEVDRAVAPYDFLDRLVPMQYMAPANTGVVNAPTQMTVACWNLNAAVASGGGRLSYPEHADVPGCGAAFPTLTPRVLPPAMAEGQVWFSTSSSTRIVWLIRIRS